MADFVVYAGNTHKLRVTVTDDETGSPLNLAGASITARFGKKVNSEVADFLKTIGSGVAVVDPAAGVFEVTLLPADTLGVKGPLYYECDVLESGGRLSTVVTGSIKITPTLRRS